MVHMVQYFYLIGLLVFWSYCFIQNSVTAMCFGLHCVLSCVSAVACGRLSR